MEGSLHDQYNAIEQFQAPILNDERFTRRLE